MTRLTHELGVMDTDRTDTDWNTNKGESFTIQNSNYDKNHMTQHRTARILHNSHGQRVASRTSYDWGVSERHHIPWNTKGRHASCLPKHATQQSASSIHSVIDTVHQQDDTQAACRSMQLSGAYQVYVVSLKIHCSKQAVSTRTRDAHHTAVSDQIHTRERSRIHPITIHPTAGPQWNDQDQYNESISTRVYYTSNSKTIVKWSRSI